MKLVKLLSVAALLIAVSQSASAQILATQTQTLDITVSAVDEFTITNSAVSQTVGVGAASFSGGTYSVKTNSSTARVIKGAIDVVFPAALNLTVTLQGGSATALTTTATNLRTGITAADLTGQTITFNTNATVAVPPGAIAQRTITYTLQ